MYHPRSGNIPRPPSPRSSHVPIRTTITPAKTPVKQEAQSSSPQPPSYPLPITPEKFPKALKLYNKYYLEKGLSQRLREPPSAIEPNNRLNIPSVQRAHTVSSPGSPYTHSVSDSLYDGVTETVVSFTGDESPGSATPNGSTELISFNGKRVRQPVRRPLTPVTKAKAALIRHLKSCWVCQTRRVPCPLEHHDIDSLERARQARTRRRAQSVPEQSRSSNASSSSRPTGTLLGDHGDQPNTGGSQGQTTSLFGVGTGIGQNDHLGQFSQFGQFDHFQEITPFDAAPSDSKSSAQAPEVDLLSEIPIHRDVAGPANLAPEMSLVSYKGPYSEYQDGQIFPLGVFRSLFYVCTHNGLCHQLFEDPEALQTHFETHFSYTRIAPAHRLVCSYCQSFNNFPSGLCSSCGSEGTIETWIYGNFIRLPTYQRYDPDGQDFLRNNSNNSSTPFFPGMEEFSMDSNFGFDNGYGNFTTDGMNQGGGFYNFQNNFEDPGSQGDSQGFNTPRSGGFPQGNWARQAKASPLTPRYWYAKYRQHKLLLLTMLLLVAFTLLFRSHEWVLTTAQTFTPISQNANLPVVGCAGVLASFALSYTYWSVKRLGVQRIRMAQCRSHRCPLHDIPTMSFDYRQTAPNTFVRGGLFS